jgi:hypothetical protein
MAMMIKRDDDWCFICQKRKSKLVGINYEYKTDNEKTDVRFIRICLDCLKRASKMIEDNRLPINASVDSNEKR